MPNDPRAGGWSGIPSDLPCECPKCGTTFSYKLNYSTVDHPYHRALHKLGVWVIFIWPPIFLLLYFAGLTNFPTSGTSVPFCLFVTCAGPSSLLYLLGHLFPKMRQMECLKCGWLNVYPFRRHRSALQEPVQPHFPEGKQQRKLRIPKGDSNRFRGLQPR